MTQKNVNNWTFDVRIRERNLKSGSVTDKDIEKYLAGLPDLAEQAEPFGTSQPALEQPSVVASPAPASAALDDDSDDDFDDEEEDEEVEAAAEAPAAPVAVPASPAPAAAPAEPAAEPTPAPESPEEPST